MGSGRPPTYRTGRRNDGRLVNGGSFVFSYRGEPLGIAAVCMQTVMLFAFCRLMSFIASDERGHPYLSRVHKARAASTSGRNPVAVS